MPLDPTRLKALRIETGLSVYALQRLAGVASPHLYRLESGERGEGVPVEMLERIAVALGRALGRPVSVSELLTPPPNPDSAVQWAMPRGRGRPRKEKNDG